MKIVELDQQMGQPNASAVGSTTGQQAQPAPTGQNTAGTPKTQQQTQTAPGAGADPAKAEADRKKQVELTRANIQTQIKALDDQKKALMQQLANMK